MPNATALAPVEALAARRRDCNGKGKCKGEGEGKGFVDALVQVHKGSSRVSNGDFGPFQLGLGKPSHWCSPPPALTPPTSKQIRPLDSRLLMGSVSQKCLLLQEELRNDRAR